ncbi:MULTISPECIES: DUF2752 domain-containing protein [Robiginitalea]|uniref:DUF2752 domain-containing protein n=1 Tax=Robiginitalea biformata (strain ATCC BAA-864 / DSM 15991 / KCTC 12146 / HTCC2501) TaxID=313596 RepID=A4CMV3_ROBBH|nr:MULTISPECIES: DUF2752 domain-containing protein [Robiginitalea]EAR14995.1 hypothetical protein RB2501_11732 [Robiginitalea biformata HTCC2501]MDC6355188.1 DUF2752 domain-containing protein [Robiginitalea sp. PM2]MDC6375597.1 DUF2752 domain-containing protein [Robiginitalea sp. SP8]
MPATDRKITWYALGGVAAGVFLLLVYYHMDPEGGSFPACPFHQLTGLLCTGCGSQRALHDLTRLDLGGAFGHNLLFPPAVLLLGWHGTERVVRNFGKRFPNSPLDHPRAPWVVLALVLLFTVLRNLPWEPFRFLAP